MLGENIDAAIDAEASSAPHIATGRQPNFLQKQGINMPMGRTVSMDYLSFDDGTQFTTEQIKTACDGNDP
jgi:hypothetical protein